MFGYGSLAAPASIARTLGRPVVRDAGFAPAFLDGFGRRWNYGSLHQRGDWHGPDGFVASGVVISLGLVASAAERCNGVVIRVSEEELARLDWRERDYERTDVTELVTGVVGDERSSRCRVVTYVPRPSAVERYEAARDERRAAIRRSYQQLVTGAFERLGTAHAAEYGRTPPPDVPVVDFA